MIGVKGGIIAWLGHVMWLDDKRTPEKILEWKSIGTGITGRPRKRWVVDIEEGMQMIGVKGGIIAWLGHVMWMDDKRTPKKILEWKAIGKRITGRPRKRWVVYIEEGMQMIEVKGWRKQCKERKEWKRITERAKTHRGL
jgi:hypothetical protein